MSEVHFQEFYLIPTVGRPGKGNLKTFKTHRHRHKWWDYNTWQLRVAWNKCHHQ